MDIKFNCEKCGQSLSIDEAGAGQLINCPKCSTSLAVPSAAKSQMKKSLGDLPPTPSVVEATKKCPFCAETIKVEAVVCRYCGRDQSSDHKWHTDPDTPPTRTVVVNQDLPIVVTNVEIKFSNLVTLIIKFWAATVIALLLLGVIGGLVWAIVATIISAYLRS